MKKIWIILGAIFGVAIVVCGILASIAPAGRKKDEKVFRAAMEEYRAVINADTSDCTLLGELATEISSSGDYARVEKAAKDYLRDVFVPFWQASKISGGELYQSGLSKIILESDQPEFKNTHATISEMSALLRIIQKNADTLFSREAAFTYLGDDLNDYYMELFDEQVEEIYSNQQMRQDFTEYVQAISKMNAHYTEILNFLAANPGKWYFEGETIVFKTVALTNQYNQILERIADD